MEAHKGAGLLSGSDVFTLSDTYGFPPELTSEIASENGFSVDMEGFEREMEAQRERARSAHAFVGGMEKLTTYEDLGIDAVRFVGYEELSQTSVVVALLEDDAPVGQASEGKKVEVVLQDTPFYPEGGGQVGDSASSPALMGQFESNTPMRRWPALSSTRASSSGEAFPWVIR